MSKEEINASKLFSAEEEEKFLDPEYSMSDEDEDIETLEVENMELEEKKKVYEIDPDDDVPRMPFDELPSDIGYDNRPRGEGISFFKNNTTTPFKRETATGSPIRGSESSWALGRREDPHLYSPWGGRVGSGKSYADSFLNRGDASRSAFQTNNRPYVQRVSLPKNKEVIFVDFLSLIDTTYQSNRQAHIPHDISDARVRLELLDKIGIMDPYTLVVLLDATPRAMRTYDWESYTSTVMRQVTNYFLDSETEVLTVYVRNRSDKEAMISNYLEESEIPRELVAYVGNKSGLAGQSGKDLVIASRLEIDYLDTSQVSLGGE